MSRSEGEQRIVRALWLSAGALGLLVLVVAVFAVFINSNRDAVDTQADLDAAGPQLAGTEAITPPVIRFTDVTLEAGIDFVHVNGAYGERLLPETMGGGVAFLDYDDDGDQDLYLVNSDHWPGRSESAPPATSRLYRNNGTGAFEDVSAESGLDVEMYGMGVAVGDYDGDAQIDVFVTALGGNRLFRNLGDGRFADVTTAAGVAGASDAWSTSAAFFDYDNDGDLDLFVCNYVGWSPEINREVDYNLAGIGRAYGPPTDFAGTNSYLYRNDDGVFSDVSADSGIHVSQDSGSQPVGKALAIHPVDINNDGWLDIAVANDTVRNFLFLNQQDGSFSEVGVNYGFAYDTAGLATGAMGIDAGFVNNDDDLAIAIGNFANEMSSFYVRRAGEDVFSDDAIVAGIGADSRRALTFGLVFLDIDLDGRLDLLSANGHVEPEINRVQSGQEYAQPLQLFWNCGSQCRRDFELVENATGDFGEPLVGRGAAYADIDADGDLDVAITSVGGRALLLRNDQELGNHWLRVRLQGTPPNTHAVGATVSVFTADGSQRRSAITARSYISQVEAPLTFGLGETDKVDRVVVTWPDGSQELWTDLAVDVVHALSKDSGTPL